MRNAFTVTVKRNDTLGFKAYWLTAFVLLYTVLYTAFDQLWNKYISGCEFNLDTKQIPGNAISGFMIGLMIIFIMGRLDDSEEE